jgi:hypothetical protein
MDGRCKLLGGNRRPNYGEQGLFAVAYPISGKYSAGNLLRKFIHEFGRPEKLTFDGLQELCGKKTEFMSNIRKYSIDYHVTEPHRPNHNFAEGDIREIRRKWFRVMVRKSVPQRL